MGELPFNNNYVNPFTKVLVGEAKWSGERVTELHQLAQQIQLNVSEEEARDTPLVAEVERLGYRIRNLTEAIHSLGEHLSRQPPLPESLDNITKSVKETEQILELAIEPSCALNRSRQLQSKILTLSTNDGPPPEVNESDIPIVDAWKNVLKSTLGKYEQVLSGLSGEDDQLEAAIDSWTLYVNSVEESTRAPIPASREGLHEAARLCQVHRSILKTQNSVLGTLHNQSMMEDSPETLVKLQDKLRNLISRHQSTIITVGEREDQLLCTITTWENYRIKIAKVQSLLLGLEQEKQGLQLRQVSRSRLDKIIQRLQSLLEQVSKGEDQVEDVSSLCQKLISSCDKTIHPILTAELKSLDQRTNNLKAALETWHKHLKNIEELWTKHDTIYESLSSSLKEHQKGLSKEIPSGFPEIKQLIKDHTQEVLDLETLNIELTKLRNLREEMIDALTPADLRLVTQRMWRLLQLQGELIHQYRMQINRLDDRLELWQLYDIRFEQFMKWASNMEVKIEGGSEKYIDALIRKLDHDYQEEIAMKNIDKLWLTTEGEELMKICDKDQRKSLQIKSETVETTWLNINEKCKAKKEKLQDIVLTISKTEVALSDLKKWLFDIETQLSKPVLFMSKSNKEIDRLLEFEDSLRREIENQSGNISSVLNLCNMIIKDCTYFETSGDTDSLQETHMFLEQRWGTICMRSADRKTFIKKTKKLWDELFKLHKTFFGWLISMEKRLANLTSRSTDLMYGKIPDIIKRVYDLQTDIRIQTKQYEDLNHKYRILARPHGRENRLDQSNEIKQMVKIANSKFHNLNYFTSMIVRRLKHSLELWCDYESQRDYITSWIDGVESQLCNLDKQNLSDEEFRNELLNLSIEYEQNYERLKTFDILVTTLYQRSCFEDCQIIEEETECLELTRSKIETRLEELKKVHFKEPCHQSLYKVAMSSQTTEQQQPMDEDFTYSLVPDSELSNLDNGFDITIVGSVGGRSPTAELKAAIDESRKLLSILDEAIKVPTPQGIEVDKMYYTFSKQLAACRSSVDLIASLIKQANRDRETEALLPEAAEVTEEFLRLERFALEKQQRMKENSETSSLTCPLCCKRNWKQFENDMWRLEQWLSHSEAIQSELHNPPKSMEDLEESAQDHREFLMDLDGHKSVIMSLNVIGRHLAEHTRDLRRAEAVKCRLDSSNKRWEGVCLAASSWQAKLQTALMGNKEFHKTVAELLEWTEVTEKCITSTVIDIDSTDDILREHVNKLLDTRSEVERCEPRVASLYQAAHHLLHTQEDSNCTNIRENLSILSRRLQLLLQLCSKQLAVLSQKLGQDFNQSLVSLASSGLYESTEFSLSRPTSPSITASFYSIPPEEDQEGIVLRSYRFFGRVVRAALPIQALMLLMLGVASMMPSSEDDYACNMANNFARSLNPVLRHEGPPPI